jgi:hypothetical protein
MSAHRSPIHHGSKEAIEAVRESLGKRTGDFERSMGRLAANVGRGFYAKSGSEFGRAMAQIPYDPYSEEDERLKENMEILAYLQKVQAANQEEQYRRDRMAQEYDLASRKLMEDSRHHKAAEGRISRAGYGIHNAQEAKLLENEIKQETGDHVEAIGAMNPQMRIHADKIVNDYISRANSASEGLQTVSRMKEIAQSNPQILNSWQFVVANRYLDKPTLMNQISLMPLSDEEKDALFEMASLAKSLNVDSIKGIPAKGINMQLERMLFGANPSARMTLNAFTNGLDKAQEGFEYGYREYGKAAEYGRKGLYYKPSVREVKSKPPTPAEHEGMAKVETPSIENLSDEELNKLYQSVAE